MADITIFERLKQDHEKHRAMLVEIADNAGEDGEVVRGGGEDGTEQVARQVAAAPAAVAGRDDDGTAASWSSNSGAFTPASSTGAHSARFHSYNATSGATGSLDLYVNLSGVGNKTLTFDYVNASGTDKVDVLVSTDGGTTFSTTPALTTATNATFTAKTAAIASTSP